MFRRVKIEQYLPITRVRIELISLYSSDKGAKMIIFNLPVLIELALIQGPWIVLGSLYNDNDRQTSSSLNQERS